MQIMPDCLVVAVQNRVELDAALDEAVELLMPAAKNQQGGISITRLASGRYEARVNSEVPFGTTVQRWSASDDAPDSNGIAGEAPRQRVAGDLSPSPTSHVLVADSSC